MVIEIKRPHPATYIFFVKIKKNVSLPSVGTHLCFSVFL